MNTYVRSIILIGIGLVVGFGAGFYTGRFSIPDASTQGGPVTQVAESTVTTERVESTELREAKAKLEEMRVFGYTGEFPLVKELMRRAQHLEAQQSVDAERSLESQELGEAQAQLKEMRANGYRDEWPPAKMLIVRIRELEAQQQRPR
jgi:hypothetical protein